MEPRPTTQSQADFESEADCEGGRGLAGTGHTRNAANTAAQPPAKRNKMPPHATASSTPGRQRASKPAPLPLPMGYGGPGGHIYARQPSVYLAYASDALTSSYRGGGLNALDHGTARGEREITRGGRDCPELGYFELHIVSAGAAG